MGSIFICQVDLETGEASESLGPPAGLCVVNRSVRSPLSAHHFCSPNPPTFSAKWANSMVKVALPWVELLRLVE